MRPQSSTFAVCIQCEKVFRVPPIRLRRGVKYCSMSCRRARTNYRRISGDGHVQIWQPDRKCYVYEHTLVWEAAHGPVPEGFELHHRNDKKADNRLENLELLTHREHMARHYAAKVPHGFGHARLNGRWAEKFDACIACGTTTIRHRAKGLCRTCYYRPGHVIPTH